MNQHPTCIMGTTSSSLQSASFSTVVTTSVSLSPSILAGEETVHTTPNNSAADNNTQDESKDAAAEQKTNDIEDLHQMALLSGSDTYSDPATGFTVFTELAHLKRGKCCGSMCRHCPYGWENVRSVRNNTTTPTGRKAKLQSGDAAMASELINRIKISTPTTNTGNENKEGEKEMKSSSICSSSEKKSCETRKKNNRTGKGGRHGGRHTSKNVPYTRTGDKGLSQLLTGEKRKKYDSAFEAMGTVDELCSIVGTVHAELSISIVSLDNSTSPYGDLPEWLLEVMSRLFDIGSHVANPRRKKKEEEESDSDGEDNAKYNSFVCDGVGGGFDPEHIEDLEDWIDEMTDKLPELSSFVLPTGGKASAQLHVARTVCRRAERRTVLLVDDGVCDPNALRYLNRLSDFFFTAARWTNFCEGIEEIQYRRPHRGAKQRGRVKVNLEYASQG